MQIPQAQYERMLCHVKVPVNSRYQLGPESEGRGFRLKDGQHIVYLPLYYLEGDIAATTAAPGIRVWVLVVV